ncbi:FAD-binding oxidoreductase [Nocardia sp. IFM 10818]
MNISAAQLTGFTGVLLRPGDPGYERARRVWNGAIDRQPAFIAQCHSAAEVAAAVRFGVRHALPIAVRGGGHSVPGFSVCEGGLMIDLSPMKGIRVDPAARVAQVEPGVLWRELDTATQEYGLATPGGEISHTGVAGLTLGGGVGWLSRAYGLTCDNLLGAELVTADGEIRTVTAESDPELMWGLRGGGGNFGIVTSFTLRLGAIPVPMFASALLHPLAHAREGLRVLLDLAATAPDELGLSASLITAPPAPWVPETLRGRPAVVLTSAYLGDPGAGAELIRPLREFASPTADLTSMMPYTVVQSMVDEAAPAGLSYYMRSEFLTPLDDSGIDRLVAVAEESTTPLSHVLLRIMGGAIERVPAGDTAFRFRKAASLLTLAAVWPDPAEAGAAHRDWARAGWRSMLPWSAGGAYVNQLNDEADEGLDRVRQAYGPAAWDRLVALKRRMDADNVFHLNQNVPPLP